MTDSQPILPEAIDLERTKFEEHARDRADKALRATVLFGCLMLVLSIGNVILIVTNRMPPSISIVAPLFGAAVIGVLVPIMMWLSAHRQRKHYNSKAQSTWTLRCHDPTHERRIDGIGPASGWRDISIDCKALPRRSLAFPKLHVRIDNKQGVLKSGHLQDGGDDTSLFVIDKVGLPIGISIGYIEPRHASQDEPWVIELTLFGDADVLETLLAWPVPRDRGETAVSDDASEANRQA